MVLLVSEVTIWVRTVYATLFPLYGLILWIEIKRFYLGEFQSYELKCSQWFLNSYTLSMVRGREKQNM